MIFIALFGVVMMLLSLKMIKNPIGFAQAIVTFSQKRYFHIFEILSRLFFAVVFIHYAASTSAEIMHSVLGLLMAFTSIFLVIIGEEKHRVFAVWSASKFSSMFRFSGLCSLFFGAFIIYSAING